MAPFSRYVHLTLLLLAMSYMAVAMAMDLETLDRLRRSPFLEQATSNLRALRHHACAQRDHYTHCFLCGKVADDSRIFHGCCQEDATIQEFCIRLLS